MLGTLGGPGECITNPLPSPSGSNLAYSVEEKGESHVWILDLKSGATRRATQLEADEAACSWSADGRQLLLTAQSTWSDPDGGLYLVDIDAGSAPTRVSDGRSGQLLPDHGGVLY